MKRQSEAEARPCESMTPRKHQRRRQNEKQKHIF